MPKRIVGFFDSMPGQTAIHEMRQGLPPVLVEGQNPTVTISGRRNFVVAPDQAVALQTNDSSSSNIFVFRDPMNFSDRTTPTATFGGNIYAAAISNSQIAVGGASPYLYVYDRSALSLLSVSTTAIGTSTVMFLAFSPDGTKLAVGCSGGKVVVYNTSDWTNVTLPTGSTGTSTGDIYGLIFSSSSNRLLVLAYSSTPIASVWELASGSWTRVLAVTDSTYSVYPVRQADRVTRGSIDTDDAFFPLSSGASYGAMARINLRTLTYSKSTDLVALVGLVCDPDPDEDAIYARYSNATGSPGVTVAKFRQSTMTLHPDMSTAAWRTAMRVSMNAAAGGSDMFAIVSTTPHELTGTVRDINNLPVARTIRAFRHSNGLMVAQTTSNSTTGNYRLKFYDAGPFDIQFLAANGELLNDLTYARVEPKAL